MTAALQSITIPTQVQLSLLAPQPLPAKALAVGGGDAIGWQIGFDHARHGLPLPAAHLHEGSPLFAGWQLGLERRGPLRQQRDPAPGVRRWLGLRLQAWAEGQSFEDQLLTPHYLQQLDSSHCPVSRDVLHDEQGHPAQRQIVRLLPERGYSAGHLVVLGRRAAAALQDRSLSELQQRAADARRLGCSLDGLDAASWARLCSLVAAVRSEAETTVLMLLPPNRLLLPRAVLALQAWVSRQLASPGWSQRLLALHDALPGVPARQAASGLSAALAPHALLLPPAGIAQRWALEDLWLDARVQRRWTSLVEQLSPLTIERLLRQLPPPPGWTVEQHCHDGLAFELAA
jgi:hypothetical protein